MVERDPGGAAPAARRFLADAMLERLARWLRVLGYDVESAGAVGDEDLARRAAAEGRTLLTRDRALRAPEREMDVLLVESDDPLAQLRQVMTRCELAPPAELFTRCLLCNTALEPVTHEVDDDQLPADVRARVDVLRGCPTCGRVYWEGAHTRRMRAALAGALAGLPPAPPSA